MISPTTSLGPRYRRKTNHAHVYEVVRQTETHVTLRSLIETMLPRQTFEENYEPVPAEARAAHDALASGESVTVPRMKALDVDDLAQEIRRVDGRHELGAGALAEALMPYFERRVLACIEATPALAPTAGEGEAVAAYGWDRYDLAKGLAALDGLRLSISDSAEYLRRSDDLLAHLSLAAALNQTAASTLADRAEIDRGTAEAPDAGAGPAGEAVAILDSDLDWVTGPLEQGWVGVDRVTGLVVRRRDTRPVEEPGEVERAVAKACKPWEFATGEPPEWGSPLHQVFVAGMTYSERLLAKFLKVQTYEGGDGSEDFDCDATMSLVNIIAAAGLWDKDEHRPATEAALAETRERLEKVEAAARIVISAEADFRRGMPEGWEGDPLTDAVAALRTALTGDAQEGGR